MRGAGSISIERLSLHQSMDGAGKRASSALESCRKNSDEIKNKGRFEMKTTKPSILFCHGIWADGSSFGKVIPPLQAEGYEVIAAQYGLDTPEGESDARAG
jgi:hypothetical protein